MIQLRNISYQYPNHTDNVLDHFDLEIQKGDVVVISGGNGSGKTTLLRMIAGIIPKFTGGLFEGNRKIDGETYDSIHAERFGMLFHGIEQQFIQSRVDQEFLYILEGQGLSDVNAQARLIQIQDEFKIQQLMTREIHTLSSGEMQLIKLALSFVFLPDVILMDEPLSHLDPQITTHVLETLILMKDKYNLTYIIADHQKDVWNKFGEKVRHIDFSKPTENEKPAILTSHKNTKSETLLSIESISFSHAGKSILSAFDQTVAKGECIVVSGPNGSGKTTLLNLLIERLKPSKGEIKRHKKLNTRMLANPVQMNFFSQKIKDEFALGKSEQAMNIFSMDAWFERYVFDLSQGEQRKIAIELLFNQSIDLLLLDEPLLHLDAKSQGKVIQAIQNLSAAGVATIITAHDEGALGTIADQTWSLKP